MYTITTALRDSKATLATTPQIIVFLLPSPSSDAGDNMGEPSAPNAPPCAPIASRSSRFAGAPGFSLTPVAVASARMSINPEPSPVA
jgi:hypothetical protein